METKDFKFTIGKLDAEAGTFDGYASVFNVVDSYGDVVEQGAFKKTLRENESFPLLWSHDVASPLGVIAGEEDTKGLRVRGELNLDVQAGREKRSLMLQRAIRGLSIGYEAIKAPYDETDKVRRLKEIKLWEISLCVFPANAKATVSDVKGQSLSEADLGALLERVLTLDVKEIDAKYRDTASKAVDRIQALLKGQEPPLGTPGAEEPPAGSDKSSDAYAHLLADLDAEIKRLRGIITL